MNENENYSINKQKDITGASRSGTSTGLASVSLNINKVEHYLTFAQSYDFLEALFNNSNVTDAQKQAQALFTAISLKETHSQDLAVQHLLSARNTSYKNAADKAKTIYRNNITTNFGFQACEERYYAAKSILDRQLQGQFIPAIYQEGNAWISEINTSFNYATAKCFQAIDGIPQAFALWEEMLRLTIDAEKINMEKLANATSNNKSLRTSVSQCETIFHKLEKRHPIIRALSFGAKSYLKHKYPRYTEALIVNELELAARKLLAETIYPTVKKIITAQIERVNNVRKNAFSIKSDFAQKTQRLRYLEDWLYCPNGKELADTEFMNTKLNQLYEHLKGKKDAMAKIFQMFCGRFNNLDAFNAVNPEIIKETILNHCKINSQMGLDGFNIMDVISDRFSSENLQYDLIRKMIAQSDGMVKVSGEHNENIPMKKYVCGPDERTLNWAVKIANDVSRQGGDWTGIICPDTSEICFVQYRALISISQLIADTAKLCDMPDYNEIVQLTDDPFVATTPRAGSSRDEIDRIIAEGILANAIRPENDHFIFVPGIGEPVNIGKSIVHIRKYLQSDYYTICQIHNAFARFLLTNHTTVFEQINSLFSSKPPIINEMNTDTQERLLRISETLLPYAKRIMTNRD